MATGIEMAISAVMKMMGINPDEARESFMTANQAVQEAVSTVRAIKAQMDRIEARLAALELGDGGEHKPQPWGNFGGFSAKVELEDDELIRRFPAKPALLRAIEGTSNAREPE
jgi:hypothetical protein